MKHETRAMVEQAESQLHRVNTSQTLDVEVSDAIQYAIEALKAVLNEEADDGR